MNKRLMMSEECRKRIKELLQIPKEDLLTNYMFQEQEINRLNNIINELEKELKEYLNRTGECKKYVDTFYSQAIYNDIKHILNKLKELKGSGNNE